MKKAISIALCLALAAGIMSGCGTASAPERGGETLRIVTTIFPEYDWVREILGDRANHVELTMLLDDGVDLHSFQPTADDMVTISNCDLFLYTGGASDSWVEDALANAGNPDLVAMNLMEVLGDGVKTEEVVEGMQESEHHHHGEEKHHEDHDHEDHDHADEHIWLSLKHAAVLCDAIADALGVIDPAHQETYAENAAAYIQKLSTLDGQYQAAVDAASTRTLLFADRFPFRYLADDYGLTYYAAFSGCSAETEASFETVAFLAGKVDELSLPCVLTIEGAAHNIAQTVVANTSAKNQEILVLDSMQSVTAADVEGGATYLGMMEQNLETLKTALG
ncbi:zinc ABC transporter substrate-binding protein [Pseudoflavonifractor sp. AF19-9AC]|uniref:metal ABC transporter substrate-binding protein n=1 Tax=Pseudoflavonifractor sp. AF19-9AC TaxID=2292244 RepID=UPI000E4D72F7|nr:metal ABC transporter substrate-binding protein [Pseudoflavonifractor sp. AF19-9AC]RHR07479.1 zinc ABC transporter substrate-binding protein [Pseudoflavonifractor sp. AF19-9AC]